MGAANLTAIKDRLTELSVVPKSKDRTSAARSRRYRQRKKQAAVVTATPAIASSSATATVSEPKRRHVVPAIMLCAALAVAAVSGSFSIVGLTAIFAGSFWPIIGLGCVFEGAKLSAVAWVARGYRASRWLKGAIVALIVALMSLNVVGTYGYLAKVHIAHQVVSEAAVTSHQAQIDSRKEVAAANVADIDRRIAQIDSAVAETTKRGRTTSAMTLVERQAGRRDTLLAERTRAASALAAVEVESAGVASERNILKADSGPVLYLSKLIGADDENLMRWFVLVIACLLDPAALLLLAASARE